MGNSRVSFSDITAVAGIELDDRLQTNTYYPYGSNIAGLSSANQFVANDYKFNGIEHIDDLGLNLHLADYRAYDALIGRWTGVDPKPNPSLSTYSGMGGNPIRYADPRGDTTYVYDMLGHYTDVIYGKLPAQIHFTDSYACPLMDENGFERHVRKNSKAFIGKNTMNSLKAVLNKANANFAKTNVYLERLYILLPGKTSKELRVLDITDQLPAKAFFNEGNRAGIYVDEITSYLQGTKFQGMIFGTGHSHPGNNFSDSEPTAPQENNRADYNQLLVSPHLALIVSKHGVTLYSTSENYEWHGVYNYNARLLFYGKPVANYPGGFPPPSYPKIK